MSIAEGIYSVCSELDDQTGSITGGGEEIDEVTDDENAKVRDRWWWGGGS